MQIYAKLDVMALPDKCSVENPRMKFLHEIDKYRMK